MATIKPSRHFSTPHAAVPLLSFPLASAHLFDLSILGYRTRVEQRNKGNGDKPVNSAW